MRVLSINAYYQDGLGYQDYYLGKEWVKMGHDVHFIASDRHFKFPDYDNTVRHIIGDRYIGTGLFKSDYGASIHRLKGYLEFTGRVWMYGLEDKIRELSPDVIICHGILNLYSFRIVKVASQLNIKVNFDEHTTTNLISKNWVNNILRDVFKKIATKKIQKKANKIIGISDSVMVFLKEYLGFTEKLEMIPLGADLQLFYPDKQLGNFFRKSIHVADENILITYTGKIYDQKRVDLIIDALNQINIKDYQVVILFVGSIAKNYKAEFENVLKQSNWKTIYLPSMPPSELIKVYNATDIAVWPAHLTGSTVDASACGCPVIINNLMAERIVYRNGIGINNENLQELIDAFKFLIKNPKQRIEMGLRGRKYVENELDWHIIAQRFLN